MKKPKLNLPKDIEAKDLTYPNLKERLTKAQRKKLEALGFDYYETSFELWETESNEFFIPTLEISGARRGGSRRTYAVGIADGKTYRIGKGPHVKAQHTVHLKKANFKRLLRFMVLKIGGSSAANQVRDRISSRRAQGQINRANGLTSWRW